MKIVINKCYGGFGVSPLGLKMYAELKGKKAYFYTQTKYSFIDKVDEYSKIKTPSRDSMGIYCSTKDYGKSFSQFPKDSDKTFIWEHNLKRTDKSLVKVVETLGVKANGWAANLRVIDILDGISYEIDDYDGIESIHEEHRSW